MRRLKFVAIFLLPMVFLTGANVAALECPPLVAAQAQHNSPKFADGLLWEVSSQDGRVGYLFGTMHISDPRVTNLPPVVTTKLADSRKFVMEVLIDLETVTTLRQAMVFDDGNELEDVIGAQWATRTADLLSAYGLSEQQVQALKPWAAYTSLSVPPEQHGAPLDMVLLAAAAAGNLQTFGLETIAEQIQVFEMFSLDEQAALLRLTVCHYERFQQDIDAMIDLYLKSDLGGMLAMSRRYESDITDRLSDILLDERNRRMSERMMPFFESGGAFVAVGALHLPGDDGLLARLEQQGFRVRPLY